MDLSDFIYDLPKEFIAQAPLDDRSSSKMMVVDIAGDRLEHKLFSDILDEFEPGDVLVQNDTKVIPARLFGTKESGGKVEVFLICDLGGDEWEVFVNGKKIRSDTKVAIPNIEDPALIVEPIERIKGTRFKARLVPQGGSVMELVTKHGQMPTPPYIRQLLNEPDKYQTVYAQNEGSVAAPTAGFHFTPDLMEAIQAKGAKVARLTLHVGLGTFVPVKTEKVEDHEMEQEWYSIPKETADTINEVLAGSGRLWVCGTTSVRALESAALEDGTVPAGEGIAGIFIYPGYEFKVKFSRFITNFHLPGSTLIMLISAYAGRERVLGAYEVAKERKYRFYSFGDAMLLKK